MCLLKKGKGKVAMKSFTLPYDMSGNNKNKKKTGKDQSSCVVQKLFVVVAIN